MDTNFDRRNLLPSDAHSFSDAKVPPRYRGIFDPTSSEPFRLSRSKIDLYMKCARCFYLDQRDGISRPSGPPYTLNNAIDTLYKQDFDHYRELQVPHPLMIKHGIDAVPLKHEKLDEWRDALRKGITYQVPETTLVITGGIDDVWCRKDGTVHIVDYKSTAKNGEVNLDADWQLAYKRQAEIYQWLFRNNGFTVSDIAYFVYCNADKKKKSFDGKLFFSEKILEYRGTTSWIEPTIKGLYDILQSPTQPPPSDACKYCLYRAQAAKVERWEGS